MNSPRSKLRGIRSASLRFADNKDLFWYVIHLTLQGGGNSELKFLHDTWYLLSKMDTTCHSTPWIMPNVKRTLRKVFLIFRKYSEPHMLWSVFFPANLWYIESSQTNGINKIIADIKPIYATSLIFAATVKSESWKIWPSVNKKGQIHVLDSPSWVVITK